MNFCMGEEVAIAIAAAIAVAVAAVAVAIAVVAEEGQGDSIPDDEEEGEEDKAKLEKVVYGNSTRGKINRTKRQRWQKMIAANQINPQNVKEYNEIKVVLLLLLLL